MIGMYEIILFIFFKLHFSTEELPHDSKKLFYD